MDELMLTRVEAHRTELEANINKLKKSLRHWQALDIDYQGLSEEFAARPDSLSRDEALKIAQEYRAEVVDEKELRELLNYDKGVPRKPEQIIELLSKRDEYVNRNVDTIKKQLNDAQKKLNALLLAEQPEFRDEAGLPLTEITEEFDEDGNVVSSKVQKAEEAGPQLVEVLKKAGVRDVMDTARKAVAKPVKKTIDTAAPSAVSNPSSANIPLEIYESPTTSTIKQVAINEDSSKVPGADGHAESAEETALRAEMLQYHEGLGEVGAIVAELDLEEGDISYGEDEDDDLSIDSDYDEDEDLVEESEDENGISRSSLQSEAYLRKMKLLEKKHGVTGMSNLGPQPDLPSEVTRQIDRPPPAEAARKAALARAEAVAKAEVSGPSINGSVMESKVRKKVAFAESLDIALEDQPVSTNIASKSRPATELTTKPFKQSIVERPVKDVVESGVERPTQKVSRFKAARCETPNPPTFATDISHIESSTKSDTPHSVSTGRIHEPTITERHTSIERAAPPSSADAFAINDTMHQREIVADYRQLRNRMIQRQGGFVHEGEQNNWGDATTPLSIEDESGKVRKISRFKAARLK